jgi:hypothetical protein
MAVWILAKGRTWDRRETDRRLVPLVRGADTLAPDAIAGAVFGSSNQSPIAIGSAVMTMNACGRLSISNEGA